MLKFALGVVTGIAATVAIGAVQVVRAEEANAPFETSADLIGRRVLSMRKLLLERMLAGPSNTPNSVEDLHEYYQKETARLDAIYYGQPSI